MLLVSQLRRFQRDSFIRTLRTASLDLTAGASIIMACWAVEAPV